MTPTKHEKPDEAAQAAQEALTGSGAPAEKATTASITVKANANVLGLSVGETGEVRDDAETRACIERGLVEEVGGTGHRRRS